MARNGTSYLYTGTPGAGQATALRAALASAGLLGITVGSLYTWGAGTSERNYFTLTFVSGAEILVCIPNGTSMSRDNMYVDPDNTESSWTMPLMFAYAPEGGFEDGLSNTIDPDTSAFVTNITTTLGLREPTQAVPMIHWRSGGPSMQLHFIQDDAVEFLAIYLSEATAIGGSTHMSTIMFSNVMFTNYETNGTHPEGMFYICSNNNATKTYRNQRCVGWESTNNTRINSYSAWNAEYNSTYPQFRDAALATIPPASGNLPAWDHVIYGTNYIFQINRLFLKKTSIYYSTFKTLIGTSTDYKYTRIIQGYLTPWDNSQTLPT